jgi:hypothetical protein
MNVSLIQLIWIYPIIRLSDMRADGDSGDSRNPITRPNELDQGSVHCHSNPTGSEGR